MDLIYPEAQGEAELSVLSDPLGKVNGGNPARNVIRLALRGFGLPL